MRIDYYPLVSRAASTLENNTSDARHSLFERIRAILLDQLRSRQPAASRYEIIRECAALESAIRTVELELRDLELHRTLQLDNGFVPVSRRRKAPSAVSCGLFHGLYSARCIFRSKSSYCLYPLFARARGCRRQQPRLRTDPQASSIMA